MTTIDVHLDVALSDAARQQLSDAVAAVPGCDAATLTIHDAPRDVADPPVDPADLVRAYLTAMEQRNIDTAQACLAPGFVMQFPGADPMTQLQDLIGWAAPRYKSVRKTYAYFDVVPVRGQGAIVYCTGALSGEWHDGTGFSGIRFIDRFEIEGGQIVRQDVWNDMAEVKATQ